jgi:hypothetical protein
MPQQQHHQEAKGDERVAQDQRGLEPRASTIFADSRATRIVVMGAGKDRRASLLGAVAQHVLKDLGR